MDLQMQHPTLQIINTTLCLFNDKNRTIKLKTPDNAAEGVLIARMYLSTLEEGDFTVEVNGEKMNSLQLKEYVNFKKKELEIKITISDENTYWSTCQHCVYFTKNKDTDAADSAAAIAY
jgi:predicted PolB exonuclease-like 3'-5' exonuclease